MEGTSSMSGMIVTGLIGVAGALGALARCLLGRFVAERASSPFPFGTLLINISGALGIGLLFSLAERHIISSVAQSVLATGFLGGYTTFSTMCWESVQLLRGGNYGTSLLYLTISFSLGLLLVLLGYALGWII
jgi:CrcB protein